MIPGKVRIEIMGCQTLGEEKDETYMSAEGICVDDQGILKFLYIENTEDGAEIRNQISIKDQSVTISKRGAVVSDMHFVSGGYDEVAYQTPYGVLAMEIRCKLADVKENAESCLVEVVYDLYSGGVLVSSCVTKIQVVHIG